MSRFFSSTLPSKGSKFQPCSTCSDRLVNTPCFRKVFVRVSSPGKVFRLLSNWTTCSTACASPRLFLWVLSLRSYFPGGALNALAKPHEGSILHTASAHRLGRGVLGYLIPFPTHAFAIAASEKSQQNAFAFGVPANINGFHPYTGRSICLWFPLAMPFPTRFRNWVPGFDVGLTLPPFSSLRPINPDNAWRLRITAAAGTKLAAPYSQGTVTVVPPLQKKFTTRGPSSFTRCRFVRVSPIAKYSRLLPPVGVRAVSQSLTLGNALSRPLAVIALVGRYLTN